MRLLRKAKVEIVGNLIAAVIIAVIGALFKLSLLTIAVISSIAIWLLGAFLYIRKRHITPAEWRRERKSGQPPNPYYYSKQIRRLALVGLIGMPLVSLGIWGYTRYQESLPPEKFIVLVADFSGPDPEKYRVTETLLNRLRSTFEKYDEVAVESLGKSISEQDGDATARAEGAARKASIIVWGWYGVTEGSLVMSSNFVILCPLDCAPDLQAEVQGEVQPLPISQIDSFMIQTQLSERMSSLCLLTLGLFEFSDEKWNTALSIFTDALQQGENELSAPQVYYYRGLTYWHLHDLDLAFNDFSDAIRGDPDYARAYQIRSFLQLIRNAPDQAISDISQAIIISPKEASFYKDRGNLYLFMQKYGLAIKDFDEAIILDPSNASYFQYRGMVYYLSKNYELALPDLEKAISLYKRQKLPKSPLDIEAIARTYVFRGSISYENKNYSNALRDLNKAIDLKPDYANAYHIRAVVYADMGNRDQAIEDLKTAIALSTEPERRKLMQADLDKLLSAQ